jgi:hypothetical protein
LEKLKSELLANFYVEKFLRDVKVSPDEMKKYYDEHPEEFAGEETVKASHILVESEEKAQDLLNKIQSGEMTFEEAAKAWEEQYNRAISDHKAEIAQFVFEKALGEGIVKAKGRNARAITALLDVDALKASENQARAIEEALETLKRDSRYLFEGDVPPPYARGTGAYSGAEDKRPTTLAGALREKFERK